jgi:hypothetical protein
LIDDAERELFARTLRHAAATHTGAALDAALAEAGWLDALAADPRTAVSLLFELQGEANAVSSALDHVVLDRLGLDTRSAPGIVLPALGRWSAPGTLDGERLAVRGLGTAALAGRASALVTAKSGDGEVAVAVATSALTLRPVRGFDPWLGLVEVTGNVSCAGKERRHADWAPAVARGQLALAHELVGTSRRMLALAREHALQRVQFGRTISAFQAVRHRLADTLVAIESADALLSAAWEDPSPQIASMAKALAGRGARTAARHCQQVLAGMGFTTEHAFHRYVRRALALDQLLGSARALTHELGVEVTRTKGLPPLLPL